MSTPPVPGPSGPNPTDPPPEAHLLPPSLWQIREQVDRLAAHPTFSRSASSLKLLRFFAANLLDSGGRPVSQRVVAEVLLGLSAGFRPTENPLVRMQMVRLRRKLLDYYAGDGAKDPVVVTLPKGRYCLAAEWNASLRRPGSTGVEPSERADGGLDSGLEGDDGVPDDDPTGGHAPGSPGAGARPSAGGATGPAATDAAVRPVPPIVLIAELTDAGLGPELEGLTGATATLLVPNLLGNGRFWAIGPLSRWRAELEGVGIEAACDRYHADYVLAGQITRETTTVSVMLRLLPRSGTEAVWTTWCSEDLTALPATAGQPTQAPNAVGADSSGLPQVTLMGEVLAGRIAVLLRDLFKTVSA